MNNNECKFILASLFHQEERARLEEERIMKEREVGHKLSQVGNLTFHFLNRNYHIHDFT